MNSNCLAKHYDKLNPEETFRLILAAGVRGDETERNRLVKAEQRITLSMPAHAPYGHAFQELAILTYIELLDGAAFYHECTERWDKELRDSIEAANDAGDDDAKEDEPIAEEDTGKYPAWHRAGELAYAAGFLLKTKLTGWSLFCERWNDAPLAAWQGFPGLDRLKRALALAEAGIAFPTPADMVRWLNSIRRADDPEVTEANIMSAERFADDLNATLRSRVEWWGGR